MASQASRYSMVAAASFDARRIERQVVTMTRTTPRSATARSAAPDPRDAQLRDISIYGCRLVTADRPRPGARLLLRIGGGAPVAATVVWSDEATAGCRFETPIPTRLVRSINLAR